MSKTLIVRCLSTAVALASGLAWPAFAATTYEPVNLTPESFTHDMVVEKTGPIALVQGGYTTASMDGGVNNDGNTWYEIGYNRDAPTTGLPAAGTVWQAHAPTNLHQFQFAPSYTASNAIMLNSGAFRTASATLTTPTAYESLSFLTSGGNGGVRFRYTITYQGGSTSVGTNQSADWFNVDNWAYVANGRVNAQNYGFANVDSNNPRLYAKDVVVPNPTLPIVKVDLEYVGGNGNTCIMAISGAAVAGGTFTPIAFTGYNADIVVEAAAPRPAAVTGVTTATMDGGSANTAATYFEKGYVAAFPTNGLPDGGAVFTSESSATRSYRMQPYNANNALMLDNEFITGTYTLATPAAYTGLSLIGASAGGASSVEVIVNYQDGTTQTNNVTVPDWYNASPIAWTTRGRVQVVSGLLENIRDANPRIYNIEFMLNKPTTPVTSLTLTRLSTGNQRAALFALSASTGAIEPIFTTQPQSQRVSAGTSVTFFVNTAGTAPITYQWQVGTNGVFVDLASQTATNLTLNSVTPANQAAYRIIAQNAGGFVTSSVANLTIISTLTDVTSTGDAITGFPNNYPAGEAPPKLFDNTTDKYLNFGTPRDGGAYRGPLGAVVIPAAGRTVITGVRVYTANDASERDPMDIVMEGSNDGGGTWSMVYSNALALPTARNGGGQALNPLTQNLQELLFANTTSFAAYRISFDKVRASNANAIQVGEVELLGTVDASGAAYITSRPTDAKAALGSTAYLNVTANGTPTPTYQWKRGTNGVYVNLIESSKFVGVTSASLMINTVDFADAGDYVVTVSNGGTPLTTAPATLTVISTLMDVTDATDIVSAVGDTAKDFHGGAANPTNIVDNSTTKYINGGSGFSAPAGFPPFEGPVGVVITPLAGATRVSGLRVYTADGNTERDPIDYKLEGSSDAGQTWVVISAGPLALPDDRNAGNQGVDPIGMHMQEILFSNTAGFTSYRLTFENVRNPDAANSMQVAEIELLGVVVPHLTFSRAGNQLSITSSVPGTLQSNTSPTGGTWTDVGPITGTTTVTINSATPSMYYRVKVP